MKRSSGYAEFEKKLGLVKAVCIGQTELIVVFLCDPLLNLLLVLVTELTSEGICRVIFA